MPGNDENITELADAATRRRNRILAEYHRYRTESFLSSPEKPVYGAMVPPPLDPHHTIWIALLSDHYPWMLDYSRDFGRKVVNLVSAGKLDPSAVRKLRRQFEEFHAAVEAAAESVENWLPAADSSGQTAPAEVHLIADHAKHVYAIGSRDIADLQYKLQRLAYAGRIDIEAHNELQWELAHDGEELYLSTISLLHDEETWDGDWNGWDNTYSDGRQVMTRVLITDWHELVHEVLLNPTIEVAGDGPINEHQEGVVCHIAPPVNPEPQCGFFHVPIEISLADLARRPWVNARWDAKIVAAQRKADAEEAARRLRQHELDQKWDSGK